MAESKRVLTLAEIAGRYHELVDPSMGPDRIRGDGDSVALMPKTYTPTVREFERLLRVMRNQAKQKAHAGYALGKLRWHIMAWYVDAVSVVESRQLWVSAKGGKRVPAKNADGTPAVVRTVAYRRDRDAREDRAQLGLEWMAQEWEDRVWDAKKRNWLIREPFLPKELGEYQKAA